MSDPRPFHPQQPEPVEPDEATDPSSPAAKARRSRRFPQVIEILGGAAVLLSTTALLPVDIPKSPPFRGD